MGESRRFLARSTNDRTVCTRALFYLLDDKREAYLNRALDHLDAESFPVEREVRFCILIPLLCALTIQILLDN